MSKPKHLGYILVAETDGTLIQYQRIFGRKNDAETTGRHLLNRCGVKSKVLEVHTRDHEGPASDPTKSEDGGGR